MQETWVWSLDLDDPLEENGYPLQYSDLENSMHCIVHGIAELDMTERLSLSFTLIYGFMYSLLNLFSAHFSMVSATSCSFTTPPPFSFPSLPNSLHNLESNRLFLMSLIFFWEKAMAPHSSTLAWKIPWTEKPGRLQSMGLLGIGHDWATSLSLFTFMHWRRKWQPTPVFLPGESQGRGSLVGCHLWGCTESDMTEVT